MRSISSLSIFLAVALLLPACGGGGGGRETIQQTLNFPGVSTNTGTINQSSGGSTFFVATGVNPSPGDTGGNGQQKGYLRFDHASIPTGARVLSATLIITQEAAIGNPYANLNGPVLVDHVETGASIDEADWVGGTLGTQILTLATNATPGTTTHDVSRPSPWTSRASAPQPISASTSRRPPTRAPIPTSPCSCARASSTSPVLRS